MVSVNSRRRRSLMSIRVCSLMVRFSRRIGGIPRDTYTPTACVRLPTIVHETLVSGRGRYLRPIDTQHATLRNSHMNARSTSTSDFLQNSYNYDVTGGQLPNAPALEGTWNATP